MAFCANCGTKIEEGKRFCMGCGKQLSANTSTPVSIGNHEKADVGSLTMEQIAEKQKPQQSAVLQTRPLADEKYCFSCGSTIKKIAEMCPKCGVNQNNRSSIMAVDIYCASCGKIIKKEASP